MGPWTSGGRAQGKALDRRRTRPSKLRARMRTTNDYADRNSTGDHHGGPAAQAGMSREIS